MQEIINGLEKHFEYINKSYASLISNGYNANIYYNKCSEMYFCTIHPKSDSDNLIFVQ